MGQMIQKISPNILKMKTRDSPKNVQKAQKSPHKRRYRNSQHIKKIISVTVIRKINTETTFLYHLKPTIRNKLIRKTDNTNNSKNVKHIYWWEYK